MAVSYYRALIVQDGHDGPDSGYGVVFPDLPGCTSAGDTRMDAATQAADALAGHIAMMIETGERPPEPSNAGTALPDWLDGIGRVAAEIFVPVEMPEQVVPA